MEFIYKNTAQISDGDLKTYRDALSSYKALLQKSAQDASYTTPEASLFLPNDAVILKKVQEVKKQFGDVKYVLVIGMGGSILGSRAVYDALYGSYEMLEPNRFPKLIFIDTTEPDYSFKLEQFLKNNITALEDVLLCAVSKSGTTTETIANTEFILSVLRAQFEKPEERLIVITTSGSNLEKNAQERGITTLSVPESVPGRFSVFSATGLLPLELAGIDCEALLLGAREAQKRAFESDNDPALISAGMMFYYSKEGKTIHDLFLFHLALETLGKWYRQLVAESIGKENDTSGNTVHAGITPTVSIGPPDLHSVAQLSLGGPQDKTTTFVTITNTPAIKAPEVPLFSDLVPALKGRNNVEISRAIFGGVTHAYIEAGIPFVEIILGDVSEASLGEFLQYKMIEIMYLGKLMNVNAFDQPAVELYKSETRRILKENE